VFLENRSLRIFQQNVAGVSFPTNLELAHFSIKPQYFSEMQVSGRYSGIASALTLCCEILTFAHFLET
jgi:hypothetical protein